MLDQIIIGIIGIVVGIVFVVYARQLVQWFGSNATMERYLGGGGTYTGLRLVGIFLTVIFFLYMTGFLTTVIRGIISALGF